MARRQVVVTGLGAVTPLGVGVQSTWDALVAKQIGVKKLTEVPHYLPASIAAGSVKATKLTEQLPAAVAAPVAVDDPKMFAPTSRETRAQRFAMKAASEALADAGLSEKTPEGKTVPVAEQLQQRVGVCLGTGMPALQDVTDAAAALYHQEGDVVAMNRIGPFFVPKILGNTPAGAIAMAYGLQGPNTSPMTACATGAHAIAEGYRWIRDGDADIVVCGATEACITPSAIAGFARMKALATKYNDDPHGASRPFDSNRCGFVMGEGSGVVVLESSESAARRGVSKVYGQLAGAGMSCDAYHVSSPHPQGRGARAAVERALRDADDSFGAADVGYVNAHATGTPMGDEIELAALSAILRGDNKADPLLVSSSKGAIGHLLGAAGAVEAVIALMALQKRLAPPTVNLDNPVEYDSSAVGLVGARGGGALEFSTSAKAVISTSFGFGGTNAALLFGAAC